MMELSQRIDLRKRSGFQSARAFWLWACSGLLVFGLASQEALAQRGGSSHPSGDQHWPRFTYDLGISAGSAGGRSYTEAQLGINTYFDHWLAWRNAGFGRFISDADNIFGVDTSLRGIYSAQAGQLAGATFFGGPGYRFANRMKDVPFVEGGLVLRLASLAIGGGVKVFMNRLVDKNLGSDTQYFLILSGAGSL